MTGSFNALDEPWIPVVFNGGGLGVVGIREVLLRSHEIRDLADTIPVSLVATARLLITILGCAVKGSEFSRTRNFQSPLPADLINAYCDRWRERFWLFHPERPFMQMPLLPDGVEERVVSNKGEDRSKPAAALAMDFPGANTVALWNHVYYDAPPALSPQEALRNLLGHLQFTPGSAVRVLGHSDVTAPLSGAAAVMPLGQTLAQTLLLSIAVSEADDLPSWERKLPVRKQLGTKPGEPFSGPLDRFTRLTRAVLLIRDDDGLVRRMYYGCGMRPTYDVNSLDPFVAYTVTEFGKEKSLRRRAVSFEDGRAWWRDLPCLLPDPTGRRNEMPGTLKRARALLDEVGRFDAPLDVLVAGTATSQSSVLRWRTLRSHVISRFSHQEEAANFLRFLVEAVEKASQAFHAVARDAVSLLQQHKPDKHTRARASKTVTASCAGQRFFQGMQIEFERIQSALADGCDLTKAKELLDAAIAGAISDAAPHVRMLLDDSPRGFRARAKLDLELDKLRSRYLPKLQGKPGRAERSSAGRKAEPFATTTTETA